MPGPLSRYVAWCVTNYFVHSQERGTPHSDIGLLFRFQRPSTTPENETESRVSALTAFGVTRTTVLRAGGRHLHQPSVAVKRICRNEFGTPRSGGRDCDYSHGSLGVKRWHLDFVRRRLTPSSAWVFPEFPRNPGSLSCEAGGHQPPVRPGIRTLSGSHSVRGGRLVAPSGLVCQLASEKRSEGVARPPGADHPTHAERSTFPTSETAAIAAGSGSARPARRARPVREIATRLTTASSSRSFTSTYS